jgi:hypothetical protein
MTSQEVICDDITWHQHPPIPAPSRVESHQAKQLHLNATITARLSILILSKTYPTTITSRHVGLLAGGFVLPNKTTRILDPYFQYFSSDSSKIIITIMSI